MALIITPECVRSFMRPHTLGLHDDAPRSLGQSFIDNEVTERSERIRIG